MSLVRDPCEEAIAIREARLLCPSPRPLLLHPLLPLELPISYRDARITNSRKGMNLLPEKIMKTFSQRQANVRLTASCLSYERERKRELRIRENRNNMK